MSALVSSSWNTLCVCRELKVALRALGFAVKKAEVLALMREYDRVGAGKIDARCKVNQGGKSRM